MTRAVERGRAQAGPALGSECIAFILLCAVLTILGILMVYSSSSIEALTEGASPTAYVLSQLRNAAIGIVLALVVASQDYHTWSERLMVPIWIGTVVLLLLLLTGLGANVKGATRWIALGPIQFQPSEFAKATIIMCAANLMQVVAEGHEELQPLLVRAAVMIGVPLVLILLEPDKGTVLVICVTMAIMLFVAGIPAQYVLGALLVGIAIIAALAFKDDYSRRRIAIMGNPWLDPDDTGYQLIQGLYAFASGGIFGVGLGSGRQKYSYLPEAHNDFIFAVLGEELGLVGTLLVLALFFGLLTMGYRIARNAPDLSGRLIATGCSSILVVQLLVNVGGLLGLMPLTGKPVPFLSYGGSSIMSTFVLVALVVSVARASQVGVSARQSSFVVHEGGQRGLRVIEGGTRTTPDALRSARDFESRGRGRVSYNPNGTRRIDLGPTGSDRLRRR